MALRLNTEIAGLKDTAKTTCTGVEMFKKQLDRGQAGDNVGALLRGEWTVMPDPVRHPE